MMGNRKKYKVIYVLLGPGKSAYVGQTSDPINRKSRYKTLTCGKQRLVFESLSLHGFDNHEFKEITTLPDMVSRKTMDFYEIYWHSFYESMGYRMMNLKSPGWNGIPSIESRQLSSDSHKGNKPWNFGTKGICKAWNKGLKKSDYAAR
jgi:hypothetical protein